MEVIAHTMEYRGGPPLGDLPVQPYTEDAYEDYRDLYNRCFRPMRQALGRYPLDCCPDRAALRAEQIFLYRHKGALAGAVTRREREIDGLIVSPAWRRQGLGRRLLAFAVGHLQGQGGTICLHVADWNRPAIALYRSMGFVITHTEIVP